MRKILLGAFFVIFVMTLCASAFADAVLYRGQDNIGAVPSVDNNSQLCVSVEDTGRIFGFKSKRKDDELTLTRGNAVIRVALGSAAGWRGYAIVPLYSAPFEKDGKFWLDSHSVAALFQALAGRGVENRLRFAKISGYTASRPGDFGQFSGTQTTAQTPTVTPQSPTAQTPQVPSSPTPTPQAARVPAATPAVPTATPQTPSVPEPSETVAKEPETPAKAEDDIDLDAILLEALRERTQAESAQTASQDIQPSQPQTAKLPEKSSQQTITEPSQTEQPEKLPEKSSPKKHAGKPQPRMQIFEPGDSKSERGSNYSGVIQGIRWTSQEGTNKKIRAVIMAGEESDPQVYMDNGKLHALFESSLENSKSIASPFAENIKAEIKSASDGVDLVFTPKGITKAEKLVLNNPRRIVFDFFYPEDANIIGTAPKPAPENIRLPGQVSETQTAQTPSAPDPEITADPKPEPPAKLPAVMTPPSTITIPTSPQAAQRLGRINNGRKTVVIDPGHGGKDPGAMDNGVREKDVNLAVGLELKRALTEKGYNVVMTRDTDIYLKLQERTDIANNVGADLFVSVHVNALPNKKSMTGFEIYIMALPTDKDAMNLAKAENREYVEGKGMDTENVDRKTEMLLRILGDLQQNNKISESTDFAAMLYNAGVRSGLPMRRVAQAPFFVLRGAGMPAVLLEIGFVTNANESRILTTPQYQQRIAAAMSEGIANYIK
ncbi:MAG: N-acetylmuramoyl-L-alanine amidase [Synergistaceae bacterium]|nr:N-acetylmuramoyl-L-alanine amidase [Synergistaceae bacterium]